MAVLSAIRYIHVLNLESPPEAGISTPKLDNDFLEQVLAFVLLPAIQVTNLK